MEDNDGCGAEKAKRRFVTVNSLADKLIPRTSEHVIRTEVGGLPNVCGGVASCATVAYKKHNNNLPERPEKM